MRNEYMARYWSGYRQCARDLEYGGEAYAAYTLNYGKVGKSDGAPEEAGYRKKLARARAAFKN